MSEHASNGATPQGDGASSQGPTTDGAQATESQAAPEAAAPPDPATQLATALRERDELKDRLLRTAADFDNYRKRARKDVEEASRGTKESVVREFVPVIDNLERALAAASTGTGSDVQSLSKGVELVLRLFTDTLGRFGVKSFVSKGTAFDPQLHEAIQQVETADHAAGTVIEEFQKGYMLGDRLVRPAMVVVAKAPSAPASSGST